jgi:hypothetical protein
MDHSLNPLSVAHGLAGAFHHNSNPVNTNRPPAPQTVVFLL